MWGANTFFPKGTAAKCLEGMIILDYLKKLEFSLRKQNFLLWYYLSKLTDVSMLILLMG